MRVSRLLCWTASIAFVGLVMPNAYAQPIQASRNEARVGAPLVAEAGAARYWLAASPQTLMARVDPVSGQVFEGLLDPGDVPEFDRLWPVLMAGAVQVRKEAETSGETLWYNPAFDCGIVVKWIRTEGRWRASQAAFVLGQTIRGADMGDALAQPFGTYADGAIVRQHLDEGGYATLLQAGKTDWEPLYQDAELALITAIARLRSAEQSLRRMRAATGYLKAHTDIIDLLVGTNLRQIGAEPELQAAMNRLGDRARLSLRVVSSYYRSQGSQDNLPVGWSIVLQSPDAPTLMLIAHFADPDPELDADTGRQAQAIPMRISILDFATSEDQP
jgi:hypothetical protein